jgi:large subunit ribosomal protein L34
VWITLTTLLAMFLIIVYIFVMSVTYNPNKRKRAKTHGFLSRTKKSTGKKILQNRRRKGRAKLAV